MSELTPKKIAALRKKIEKRDSVFAEKKYLDFLYLPSKIIGRESQAESILGNIMSLRDGFVVPMISVYGRSGSGKSTVVKFVLENLSDVVSCRFVNLRKAKTVFGCANLILSELGSTNLSSAEGINKAIDLMEKNIESILNDDGKKFFVLVLDEYDVIFSDRRGNPSDFVYKILQLEENLREKGYTVCTITISNNALDDYALDDRVKSRMGGCEIFFRPYGQSDVFRILKDRASHAFRISVSDDTLEYCALLSSEDHGDARRALDLLRVAGETCNGNTISRDDVDNAKSVLQKDRATFLVSQSSIHQRAIIGAMCSLSLFGSSWNSTSEIYKKYSVLIGKTKPLSYRRIVDLLVELDNYGLFASRTISRGRYGYGNEYKLKISPDMMGPAVNQEWWENILQSKKNEDARQEYLRKMASFGSPLAKKYSKLFGKYGL